MDWDARLSSDPDRSSPARWRDIASGRASFGRSAPRAARKAVGGRGATPCRVMAAGGGAQAKRTVENTGLAGANSVIGGNKDLNNAMHGDANPKRIIESAAACRIVTHDVAIGRAIGLLRALATDKLKIAGFTGMRMLALAQGSRHAGRVA